MPVHINEIVIRAIVRGGDRPPQGRSGENIAGSREDLVDECVEQVLTILEERSER